MFKPQSADVTGLGYCLRHQVILMLEVCKITEHLIIHDVSESVKADVAQMTQNLPGCLQTRQLFLMGYCIKSTVAELSTIERVCKLHAYFICNPQNIYLRLVLFSPF